MEGDGGSIRKGVRTLVQVTFDVVEVGGDDTLGGGVGVDFDLAKESEVEGEKVRVGGVSSCLEEGDDEVGVAVEVEGLRPPFRVVFNGKLNCKDRRYVFALVGGGEGGGGGFVGDLFGLPIYNGSRATLVGGGA